MPELIYLIFGFLGKTLLQALAEEIAEVSIESAAQFWDQRVLNKDHVKRAVQKAFKISVAKICNDFRESEWFNRLESEEKNLIRARCDMLKEKETVERLFPLSSNWTQATKGLTELRSIFTGDREQLKESLIEALQDPYLEGVHPAFIRYFKELFLDIFVVEFTNSAIQKNEKVRSAVFLSFLVGIEKSYDVLNVRLEAVYQEIYRLTSIRQKQTEVAKYMQKLYRAQTTAVEIITLVEQHTRNYLESLYSTKTLLGEAHNLKREVQSHIESWIRSHSQGFAIVVGEAGVGKTHLLAELAAVFLKEETFAVLFYKAEDFVGHEFDDAIVNAIGLKRKALNLDDVMRDLSKNHSRRVVFFLDTLDLISSNHGPTQLRKLLLTLGKYDALLVGASRPLELEEFKEFVTKKFSLPPLSDKEVLMFLSSLEPAAEQAVAHCRRLMDLCKNPLHARMLVESFEKMRDIPTDLRLQELFNRYWSRKVAGLRKGLRPPAGITREKVYRAKENLVEQIALRVCEQENLTQCKRRVQKDFLAEHIHDYAFNDLLSEGTLRQRGEDGLEFLHQTLWEYAAAKSLIKLDKVDGILEAIWRPLNRGVIKQIGIQSHEEGATEIFEKLVGALKEAPFLSRVILVDLLMEVEALSEAESELLADLVRDDPGVLDHVLGLVIYEGGRHSFDKLFELIRESCTHQDWEIRRRITEALPNLVRVDAAKAIELMKILRTDYDDRMRSDVRRRVVEALPALSEYRERLPQAIELARYRPGDEVYAAIAIVEFLSSLPSDTKPSPDDLFSELYAQQEEEVVHVLEFLNRMLREVKNEPSQALSMMRERLNDDDRLVRICIARSVPQLLPSFPHEALDILLHYARPKEDKQVRRPVAKASRELVVFMRRNEDQDAQGKARYIFYALAADRDSLIRRTICDNLDDLLEIEPETVMEIVEEHFVKDNNLYVKIRSQRLAARLINYFPDQRIELTRLIDRLR